VIDLHCHILPGIDDGPSYPGDSVAMARHAEADQIGQVCATPHIRHDHDVRIQELAARVADLNGELEREGCTTRVLPGGELAESQVAALTDAELDAITLGGGGRWLLLEPAPGPLGGSLVQAVDRLADQGYRCLVAHPERHLGPDYVEILTAVCEHGALIQLTADLFLREDTADTMFDLAERRFCHVLGTDSHSPEHGRPPRLSEGLAVLRAIPAVAPHVDWIGHEAPAAIVRGEDVAPPWDGSERP
jgi:protein-tyrosine phosphatase